MNQSFSQNRFAKLSWYFLAAGFFTGTWDRLLAFEFRGFTIKVHYFFFFAATLCLLVAEGRDYLQSLFRTLTSTFLIAFVLLFIYYLGSAPWSYFPYKSIAYSAWLLFDILLIVPPFVYWGPRLTQKHWLGLVAATVLFNSAVVVIDHFAFRHGYPYGLIGFNQNQDLHLGISRPAAFSYEPSYQASFLALGILCLAPLAIAQRAYVLLGALLVSTYALIATTSRTGLACMLAGMVLVVGMESRRSGRFHWKMLAKFFAVFAVLGAIFVLLTPQEERYLLKIYFFRFVYMGEDGSGSARLGALKAATAMARETHWLGTGLGASFWYWVTKHEPTALNGNFTLTPDQMGKEAVMSTWGQLWAEGGIPAFLLFSLAGFLMVYTTWTSWLKTRSPALAGALVAMVIYWVFIANLVGNVARVDIWIWYGLWSALLACVIKSEGEPKLSS